MPMKKQKARGQVRRFLRRSIACLLAIVGMGMAAVTAGLPQPLGWLGGLGGIQTAMAAQARAARNRAREARGLAPIRTMGWLRVAPTKETK